MKYNAIQLALILMECKSLDDLIIVAKTILNYPEVINLNEDDVNDFIVMRMYELTN